MNGYWKTPNDWDWKELGSDSVCEVIMGQSPPGESYNQTGEGTPFFQGKADFGEEIPTARYWCTDPRKISRTGDVLLSVRAPVGPVNLTPFTCVIGRGLAAIRPTSRVDTRYLFYGLKSLEKLIESMGTGTTFRSISKDKLSKVLLPIPFANNAQKSLLIQRQIVARIEALLSEVREMREINQKIIEDTQQLLGAFLNQTFENLPGKENKTIDEVGFVKGGKRLPKGESFAAQPTPYPYLRVTDFRNFGIDEVDLRYLTPEVHTQIRNYIISDQDVFISIAGTIGLVGTVPAHLSGSNLTENAAKIVFRPAYQDKIKNKYLMYFLASPQGKKQIEARTKAAGQPKLALERIKTITFPYIDSIPQQEAIIEKIEAVQSEVTEMLRTQQADEKLISQVEESILSQAFQGNL